MEPSLLLLLWNNPRHGYDLLNALPNFGFLRGAADPAAVYRTLRHMEDYGLVKSEWDTSGSGPAKRLYTITDDGKNYLNTWVDVLGQRRDALSAFLNKFNKVSDNDSF